MRRIAIAVMSTISGLVLLFCYHTSQGPRANIAVAEGDGAFPPLGDGTGSSPAAGTDPAASPTDPASPTDQAPSPSPSGDGGQPPAQSSQPAPTTKAAPTPQGVTGTFTGNRVQTQWGPVRVRITVQNGHIVRAQAIEYPNDNGHDLEINSWAVPQLQDETVQAGSAQIQSLGGATVTSMGYISSLQSALDKAHL